MIITRCDRCHADTGSTLDVHFPFVTWRNDQKNCSPWVLHFDMCAECAQASRQLMEELSKQIYAFLGVDPEDV